MLFGLSAEIVLAIASIVALAAGLGIGFIIFKRYFEKHTGDAGVIIKRAEEEAGRIRDIAEKTARDAVDKMRRDSENEIREKRRQLETHSSRLEKREDTIDEKLSALDKKDQQLQRMDERAKEINRKADEKLTQAEKAVSEIQQKMLEIARLTPEQARKEALDRVEKEMDQELGEYIHRRRDKMREEADKEAREIILQAIQRCTVDVVQEGVVSTVDIPNDEMKGRIIGREGRNIRAFEQAAGVDVIVDDTPGVVVVSSFDSVRREIGRRSIEKLVQDGRIHPARIEDIIQKTTDEVERVMQDAVRKATQEVGVAKLKPREMELLGRLRFRTSYGQNVLAHCVEVAAICGIIAGELHLNEQLAKRAGLLHDIGKAVDHEVTGTHPNIGADILKSLDEPPEVVNAAASHHEDVPAESIYAFVVQSADAISASRPGARREDLERYVQRLQALENIAAAHEGVDKAFAIHAGREVRVLVRADKLGDLESERLAKDIAKEIEEQHSYPGEIKVTVIREKRYIEYAR